MSGFDSAIKIILVPAPIPRPCFELRVNLSAR